MTMADVTYIFRDGTTYAIREGKVVASSIDPDEVERQVRLAFGGPEPMAQGPSHGGPSEMPRAPHDLGGDLGGDAMGGESCPGCGAPNGGTPFCPECGEPLKDGGALGSHGEGMGGMGDMFPHDEPSPGIEMGGEAGPYMAKTVTTPNGLKGMIMGKVATTWGEEVTIRMENGRIVHLPVGTELHAVKTAAAPKVSPVERLEARLAHTYDGTRDSLVARSAELEHIRHTASALVRGGVSDQEAIRLDGLAVTAHVERAEINDALAHLDDVESIAAPGFSITAAHSTAGVSREDGSWLDAVYDDMIKTAQETDYTTLMDEGPEAFAAELPDVALADTGTTRQMASHFIAEKTAGVARQIAQPYIDTFLSRVEDCRRAELAGRKQTIHKEAAAQEDQYKELPDDSLFL